MNITIAFINWYRYLSIAILERKLLGALAMATFIKKKPDPRLIKVEMKMCRWFLFNEILFTFPHTSILVKITCIK